MGSVKRSEAGMAAAMREGMRAGLTPLTPLGVTARDGVLEIFTPRGIILGLLAGPHDATVGVLMVGGALGGFSGPAGTVYADLAGALAEKGIASMRLHYRRPNDLEECVMDVLLAVSWWKAQGVERTVIGGHSFGGAVAISAAGLIPEIVGAIGLASQTAGTELVEHMRDKPLLLLHGDSDPILPAICSENIYARASEPKELVILPGCGHLMTEAAAEVLDRMVAWIPPVLRDEGGSP